MSPEIETVDGGTQGLTVEDVRGVVDDALRSNAEATNEKYDDLKEQIVVLGDSVALLTQSDDAAADEDTVTVVRLAPEQVDKALSGFRVLCSESLVIMILLALLCGLTAWRIFSGRWRYG